MGQAEELDDAANAVGLADEGERLADLEVDRRQPVEKEPVTRPVRS